MSFTKRQIVEGALGDLAMAAYVFDITPDELQASLARIESMLRSWASLGIQTGYVLPTTPGVSDPDDDSGMLDMYEEAVRLNGALRIAPQFGKTVAPELRTAATLAYQAMLVPRKIPSMQLPRTLPVGSGNRSYGYGWPGYFRPCLPAGIVDPSVASCNCDDEVAP